MTNAPDRQADAIIGKLGLSPHPEGGYYREIWRGEAADGKRGSATSIYFLLKAGQRSHWHRVDASEIWLWQAGDPLMLSLSKTDDGPVKAMRLGPDVLAGDLPQYVIPPYEWQAAAPMDGPAGYCLVSCVVSPAFDFAGFQLAADGWAPGHGREK